uniref:carboxypeptidase-like regulatory domain-containing protein n=1 Tax=Flavobacterium sp. TaxID=239 RepID=UPI00404B0619
MRSKFKWIFTLLVAFTMQFSFAQEKTVTGVVSDELGPIAGANVVIEGTTRGTTTDFDGNYTIKAKQGEVLVISYTGKKTAKVKVATANSYNVSLKDDVVEGIDVVVTAYGVQKKESIMLLQVMLFKVW